MGATGGARRCWRSSRGLQCWHCEERSLLVPPTSDRRALGSRRHSRRACSLSLLRRAMSGCLRGPGTCFGAVPEKSQRELRRARNLVGARTNSPSSATLSCGVCSGASSSGDGARAGAPVRHFPIAPNDEVAECVAKWFGFAAVGRLRGLGGSGRHARGAGRRWRSPFSLPRPCRCRGGRALTRSGKRWNRAVSCRQMLEPGR